MKLRLRSSYLLLAYFCTCLSAQAAIVVFTANDVQYALTQNTYSATSDWSSNVSSDLVGQEVAGSGETITSAFVADWVDLKTNFDGDTAGFISLLGGQYGNNAYVLYNGAQTISGYGYFAEVHFGDVPGGWFVIDTFDSGQIDLGRWTGNRYIVAEISTDPIPVPEPAMFAAFLGFSALLLLARRRR